MAFLACSKDPVKQWKIPYKSAPFSNSNISKISSEKKESISKYSEFLLIQERNEFSDDIKNKFDEIFTDDIQEYFIINENEIDAIFNDVKDYIELFWVYFPAARDVLHEAKAFNDRNSAMPFTFDHLLNSRRFNAVIYLEENVYGDREIKEYMKQNAQMQLLESERVKEKIRNFELDMWNY
mgnify:CR=1 FL=1